MKDEDKNKDKTRIYETQKTKVYSTTDKTRRYNHKDNYTDKFHDLSIHDEIVLNGKKYEILELISEGTGEAIIYKIKDVDESVKTLKLYFQFRNWKEEPNKNSLSRIVKLSVPNILKLYDFATVGSGEKYKGDYCFEIAQYAEGGNLFQIKNWKEKYSPEFIWQQIVPQLFEGIRVMHENSIIHTDIKPSNIFYLDKEQTKIVIGDYGSSKTYEDEESDSRITSVVKSTQFYMPSEQGIGQLSNKNDYFAFGMVLLHLLYPKKVGTKEDYSQVERKKEKGIRERLYEGQNPVLFELSSRYSQLNQLILGLTQDHHSRRWGEKEVGDFLRGRQVDVKNKGDRIGAVFLDLGSEGVLRNNDDFIAFMKGDMWEEMLVNHLEMRMKILGFLRDTNSQAMSKDIWRIVNVFRQHEYTLGKSAALSLIQEAIIRYVKPWEVVVLAEREFLFDEKLDEQELKIETFRYLATLTQQKQALKDDFPRYIYVLEFLLGTHSKGKALLASFWKKMGLSNQIPNDFTIFSPSVFAQQKYADKTAPLLDDFIIENSNDQLEWHLTLDNFTEDSIQYQLEGSLREWLDKHKIPLFPQSNPSTYKIGHKATYAGNYQDYRKENYNAILKGIAKKHTLNPNQLTLSNTNDTIRLIAGFLNQSHRLWTVFGEKHSAFCLFYDETQNVSINGENENVFQYDFRIDSSLFYFLQKNGFPRGSEAARKKKMDFQFTYEEKYPWQNFFSLEWQLEKTLEDIATEISEKGSVEEIIVDETEWDKIEEVYTPFHEKLQSKLRFRYGLFLFVVVAVFLSVIFVEPVFGLVNYIFFLLFPILKWVITIALFLALLYGVSVMMEKKL